MPIRKELRHFYRGKAYAATRERIKQRAKNKCEQCRKPNHRRVYVVRLLGEDGRWLQFWTSLARTGRWVRTSDGSSFPGAPMRRTWRKEWKKARCIRVICTLAHLNHTPGDRDENLRFLCQWCHLQYDQGHHKETRSIRKDAGRPLLHQEAVL